MALPCGRDQMDVLLQSNNLKMFFINYLRSKDAAGIVNDSVSFFRFLSLSCPSPQIFIIFG